ncbi:MAG: hypothetical protein DSY55_03800 [Clostridia bacterium]|nr:MAG: hypothetical protein DSY55_03800 [Clostridia bacterium]
MSFQRQRKRISFPWALLLGALLLTLLSGKVAYAQDGPPRMGPPLRTITVIGRGSVTMKPDVAHTSIGVTIADQDIKMASQKAQTTIASVRQALQKLGVDEKDVQTTNYSIHLQRSPEMYERTEMEMSGKAPKPVYVVDISMRVLVRDVDQMGDIMAAAIEAGANNIYGVDFSADKPEEVMAQARKLAVKDARARAEELAALHGVAVGEVISISEITDGYGPMPMLVEKAAGMGGGGGGFAPGQLQVMAQLQVVYAIKSEMSGAVQITPTPAPMPAPGTTTSPAPQEPPAAEKETGAASSPDKLTPLTILGNDNALLRKFVSYWFAQNTTFTFPSLRGKDELLLGSLPDNLPFDPDVLNGMTVLGAFSQKGTGGGSILLESKLPPEDVIANLTRAWEKEGVTRLKTPFAESPRGVFDVGDVMIPTLFCPAQGDFWIELTVAAMVNDATSVRINIQRPDEKYGNFSPCNIENMSTGMPPGMTLLPHLNKPEDAQVTPAESGGGPNFFYQSATITTDLGIADLADFYQKQLQEKGWDLVGSDHSKSIAQSEWQLTDKKGAPWVGSLLITKRFTRDNAYYVTVRVERARK